MVPKTPAKSALIKCVWTVAQATPVIAKNACQDTVWLRKLTLIRIENCASNAPKIAHLAIPMPQFAQLAIRVTN